MTHPSNPSTSVVVISADDLAALIRREVRSALAEGDTRVGEAPTGWLMASEAAQLAGMSRDVLRKLTLDGGIPAWALLEVGKEGGRYRYSAKWCSGEARR